MSRGEMERGGVAVPRLPRVPRITAQPVDRLYQTSDTELETGGSERDPAGQPSR